MASLQIFQHYKSAVVVLIIFLLPLLLLPVVAVVKAETTSSSAASINNYSYSMAKPNCQEKCGDVIVPYPFGIGKGCYRNKMFEATCHGSTLFYLGTNQVFSISMDDGSIINGPVQVLHISMDHYVRVNGPAVVNCQKKWSGKFSFRNVSHHSEGMPYLISHTKNKFVSIGCDVFTYITEFESAEYICGCASLCYNTSRDDIHVPSSLSFAHNKSSCSGIGCCQTSLPKYMPTFDARTISLNTQGRYWTNHPCKIAFIAENNFTQFSKFNLSGITDARVIPNSVPLVFDWAIGNNISCDEARTRGHQHYACGPNTDCSDFNTSYGHITYQCRCSQGYQGNPYLPNGCQDVDECKGPKKDICPYDAVCNNTEGSYSCICPPGYHSIQGNGIGCIPYQGGRSLVVMISLGMGIALSVLVLVAIGVWLHSKFEKRQKNKIKEKFFKRNGGLLLQQQITSSKQSVESAVKTKLFIAEELKKATHNFNESRVIGKGALGIVYKGILSDGSIVAVKKSNIVDENQVGQFINEVIILSHINHRNIVKLLGCCLETEVPILVYEYVSNGTLSSHLHNEGYVSMSWNNRLRVATECAGALAYLHSCASTAIIHRDIKSSNILLDENYRAVVSDFGLSRLVPLNMTHWTTLVGGTFGYFDPEYFRSGQLTDKSDVYAFGVILAELLTGKQAISSDRSYKGLALHFRSSMKQNSLFKVLDTLVVNEGQDEEIHVVATLAKRCLKLNSKKRPSMKEVAAELDQLRRTQEQPLIQQNSLDNCYSMSERSFSYTIDAVEEES